MKRYPIVAEVTWQRMLKSKVSIKKMAKTSFGYLAK
jgi:hypothetical protein